VWSDRREVPLQGVKGEEAIKMSRFTIEFSEKADKEINDVAERLGVKSKAEVLRKALALLNYVTEEQEGGSKLILENEKEKLKKEIVTI
jgi:metal-responsive CopG/Arc/MetJ family transcriptional regulator